MAVTYTDEGMALYWFPIDTAITGSWAALKTTDFALSGVKNLSDYAIVGGCEFVGAPSDTLERKRYSDKGKNTVPTTKNYTGKGQFERSRTDLGALDSDDVLALFDDRQIGYIVKRLGIPEATAVAASQDYEYFKFGADHIATLGDADGSTEYIEVGFLAKGDHGFGTVASGT